VKADRLRWLVAEWWLTCRPQAVLCELVAGGISKEITAAHAARVLESAKPSGTVELARCELAAEFPGDLRRIDAQMRGTKKKLAVAVRASGTTTTEIFGVGPVIAAIVIGCVVDVSRFASRDHFAACNGTAPIEVSSGNRKIHRLSRRGNRRPATPFTWPRSPRSATAAATAAPTTTRSSPRARRAKMHSAPSSDGSATPSSPASRPTPGGAAAAASDRGPGGQPGSDSFASAAGSHPDYRLFGQATPEPGTTLRPATHRKSIVTPKGISTNTRKTS
jgi:transposase